MRIEPLGDAAFIVRSVAGEPWAAAQWLRSRPLAGIRDVVASYETLGVYFEPGALSAEQIRLELEKWSPAEAPESKRHRIPVCYKLGEDTERVAQSLGISPARIREEHTAAEYRCYAVGFCPGFGYLGWLPPALEGVPRLPSPRVAVEAGSIGITGRQTAAYPLSTPGGWNLIGRTPLTLVDVEDGYFPLQAGDRVQFFAIDLGEYDRLKGERL